MRVNPNSELVSVTRTPSQIVAGDPRLGADQLSITTAQRLTQALEQTPATRAGKVAQAQTLVKDTNYPPPELIRKIAALFAMNVDSGKGPDHGTTD